MTRHNSIFKLSHLLSLTVVLTFLFGCNDPASQNTQTNKKENILVHSNRSGIKTAQCAAIFDSATTFANQGEYKLAQVLLFKCNDIEPNNGTILNALGVSYYALGDNDNSLKYYLSAIAADSLTFESYAGAGSILKIKEQYPESEKILKIGYAKTNIDQFTHYTISSNLALTYYSMGNCSKAKEFLSIAKKHGFDNNQFDDYLNKFEKELISFCK